MAFKEKKLPKAIKNLEDALKQYHSHATELNFMTVSKAFETLVEYAWRVLKKMIEEQGLEAPSPKMAIKEAAKLHFISDPETWLDCLEARNSSVHDYFGIPEKEYVTLSETLLTLVRQAKALS